MEKMIEQLTEDDLQELWIVIGGTPHLYEYGKDEL
jgi:CTP:phosphocholine cytidylyltransferase-like protein